MDATRSTLATARPVNHAPVGTTGAPGATSVVRGAPVGPLPDVDEVAVSVLIERHAIDVPDEVAFTFEDEDPWTWSRVRDEAIRAASHLTRAGLRPGDRMMLISGNGPGFLRAWLGCTRAGATLVPINPALHGDLLRHAIELAGPTVAVFDPEVTALPAVDGPPEVIAIGDLGNPPVADEPAPRVEPVGVADAHSIVLTSGTTGPSKGVIQTNLQVHVMGRTVTAEQGLGPDDILLLDLALYHSAGLIALVGCVTTRTTAAIRGRPEIRRFWEVARETGATMAYCVAAADLLMAQPPTELDSSHRVHSLIVAPLPSDPAAFSRRFGVSHLSSNYGMSEGGAFVSVPPGTPLRGGSCGRVRPGFELRIVDDEGEAVPAGEKGELVVRHEWPDAISPGYVDAPEATKRAWRDGWFHTGDVLSCDQDGYFTFHERVTDSIRRRGESISSFDVERALAAHPTVEEVACVGHVEVEGAEPDVRVFVVARHGASIAPEDLFFHAARSLPHFMVPRYVDVVDALPKTLTSRVQKHALRDRTRTSMTWDAEDAGHHMTRAHLVALRRGPVDDQPESDPGHIATDHPQDTAKGPTT